MSLQIGEFKIILETTRKAVKENKSLQKEAREIKKQIEKELKNENPNQDKLLELQIKAAVLLTSFGITLFPKEAFGQSANVAKENAWYEWIPGHRFIIELGNGLNTVDQTTADMLHAGTAGGQFAIGLIALFGFIGSASYLGAKAWHGASRAKSYRQSKELIGEELFNCL